MSTWCSQAFVTLAEGDAIRNQCQGWTAPQTKRSSRRDLSALFPIPTTYNIFVEVGRPYSRHHYVGQGRRPLLKRHVIEVKSQDGGVVALCDALRLYVRCFNDLERFGSTNTGSEDTKDVPVPKMSAFAGPTLKFLFWWGDFIGCAINFSLRLFQKTKTKWTVV